MCIRKKALFYFRAEEFLRSKKVHFMLRYIAPAFVKFQAINSSLCSISSYFFGYDEMFSFFFWEKCSNSTEIFTFSSPRALNVFIYYNLLIYFSFIVERGCVIEADIFLKNQRNNFTNYLILSHCHFFLLLKRFI